DTGMFDEDRYFDVEVEYAKADANDILMRVSVHNRGPESAPIHVLPQAWFRNTWSWCVGEEKPMMREEGHGLVRIEHPELGLFHLSFDEPDTTLFCENETNMQRVFGVAGQSGHPKDAFHDYVVGGRQEAVNSAKVGTKAAGLYRRDVPAGGSIVLRARLRAGEPIQNRFEGFAQVFATRRAEADAFYAAQQARIADEDLRRIQRQAFAGMLWNKQFYHYNVSEWLDGDPAQPPPPASRKLGRNRKWRHMICADVISMPDKWEYPWFAAWDLAFHCVTFSLIDPDFAKSQLTLLCKVSMMHPDGELPAYEWAFGDVNPPVHAWAALRVFDNDRRQNGGAGDIDFLEGVFLKLLMNFTWWVNRKDSDGRNIFEGGFLGLDNIGLFDRSAPLPTGGYISQSDGTAWMAMYCLNMMRIALELGAHDATYEELAIKFFEHFLYIAKAMTDMGEQSIGLWDDDDDFYYDVLCMPDGQKVPMRLRSMVGLIPLFAVEVVEEATLRKLPGFWDRLVWYRERRGDLAQLVSRWAERGKSGRHLLSLARAYRTTKILKRMLDESEFLSPHGIRALSRSYLDHPYMFEHNGARYGVKYLPGESDSGVFGGNSNWRGPVWMPVNFMMVESLRRFHDYYGDDFTIEYPTGSGVKLSLGQIADELSRRLTSLFRRGADGRRPVLGSNPKLQNDPHFRDYIPFHEYFHGEDGHGLGASCQTGWTGLVANLIDHLATEPAASSGATPGPASEAAVASP
ncbi:MAG: glucosidase, partial [Microvirga sp.]